MVLAVLAVLALSVAATTFDAVERDPPGLADSDADPDASDVSDAAASPDDGHGVGALASPFEGRLDADLPASSRDGDVPVVPVALAALAVCTAAVFFLTGSRATDRPDEPETTHADESASPDSHRVTWHADADANEVYRSWRRFADRVGGGDARSPAELAAAARNRGLDERGVRELTSLFREVRYGGAEPTHDREQRATAALRRLDREDDP